ncbi:MAG: hypothetical protein L0Z50_07565, partial [Verrucomicrobiales bacterium]|nr:hypothetical protein [Verrucomicrobiales bacterium]
MSTRTKITLASAGILALAACFLLRPAKISNVPMPSPNGFHEFIRAGQSIQETTAQMKELTDTNSLRDFVADNAEGLALIRSGLRHESRVVIDLTISLQAGINSHLQQVTAVQKLVPALLAEGRLAELENRSDHALMSYLDALRVSHESVRGGVLLHRISGFSMEQLAAVALRHVTTNLNAAQCRHAVLVLEEIELQRELIEVTAERERQWAFLTGGWREKVLLRVFRRTLRRNEEQIAQQFRTRRVKA